MNSFELHECAKVLDSFPRAERKEVLHRLARDFYLRKGLIPPHIYALLSIIDTAPPGFRFNP